MVEGFIADSGSAPEGRILVVLAAAHKTSVAHHKVGPNNRATPAEKKVSQVVTGVELKPGDLVVLTGMSEERKRQLTAIAEARGLVVWSGVKKGVAAVNAQDRGSQSSKARKAREYGIPVVGEGVITT